jgi:hypothetical protein
MSEFEYNSNPTLKDFKLLMKQLDNSPWKSATVQDDMVMALAMALMAAQLDQLRRTGRTTRKVDLIIQSIFEKPGTWIIVSDHAEHQDDNSHIWHVLMRRIANEHQHLVESEILECDRKNSRIRLMMDEKKFAEVKKKLAG